MPPHLLFSTYLHCCSVGLESFYLGVKEHVQISHTRRLGIKILATVSTAPKYVPNTSCIVYIELITKVHVQ